MLKINLKGFTNIIIIETEYLYIFELFIILNNCIFLLLLFYNILKNQLK